jgi:hypothetical protein
MQDRMESSTATLDLVARRKSMVLEKTRDLAGMMLEAEATPAGTVGQDASLQMPGGVGVEGLVVHSWSGE